MTSNSFRMNLYCQHKVLTTILELYIFCENARESIREYSFILTQQLPKLMKNVW